MANVGLLARVKAKAGQEQAVADFLKSALALAQQEEQTVSWYAWQIDQQTFGIFDTFNDETGRGVHLNGQIAAQLMQHAGELLSEPPTIEKIDILAEK